VITERWEKKDQVGARSVKKKNEDASTENNGAHRQSFTMAWR
jgi:hypothetical protein